MKKYQNHQCIVCNAPIENDEIALLAEEFKPFPAHKECFDTYETADSFLECARKRLKESLGEQHDQAKRVQSKKAKR